MGIFFELLNDEAGSILSAEAVVVGSVLLVGATTGLHAVTDSIDAEFTDFAAAIRQLDQSYSVERVEFGSDWSAGSSYQDVSVEEVATESRQDVCVNLDDEELAAAGIEEQVNDDLTEIELKYSSLLK